MSLFNPWVILGIIIAMGAAAVGGAKIESDHRDAQLLVQEQAFHEAYVRRVGELRANADGVSAQLNKERAARGADQEHFSLKLLEAINAKQLGKCEADSGGKPDAAPTIFVNAGLWDAALTIGNAAGSNSGRADGASAGADFAPLEEAYANLGKNSDRWAGCRAQVKGWQGLAVKNGWVNQ
jgi:hypothetical protein